MKSYLKVVLCLLITILCLLTDSVADSEYQQIHQFVTNLSVGNTALAYWIEDLSGTYKQTIYVTYKVAKKGMGITRPSILPVWAGRRNDEWGAGYPTTANPLPDAVTSATPGAGNFTINRNLPSTLEPGNYYYFVEINVPWDPNVYYTDSTRGQPSVVFRGNLKIDAESTNTTGIIVGHGHDTGANNLLATNIDSLTTAINLIQSISVNHYFNPIITTNVLNDAYSNSLYSKSLSIHDPNSGDSHIFQLLTAPAWLSINNNGVLSGTPGSGDVGNDIQVIVRVVDSYGLSDTLITSISVINTVSVEKDNGNSFFIDAPHPNPFNPVSTITYFIPSQAQISFNVYSLSGQKVALLLNGIVTAGKHEITFDGSGLASGMYIYRFESGSFNKTGKMLLIK